MWTRKLKMKGAGHGKFSSLPGNPPVSAEGPAIVFSATKSVPGCSEVEIATLKTLPTSGSFPAAISPRSTPVVEQELLAITTTEVDDVERKVDQARHSGMGADRQSQGGPGASALGFMFPLTSYDAGSTPLGPAVRAVDTKR